jgi:hypothetical protein
MVAAGDEALKKLIAAIEKVKIDCHYFAHLHINTRASFAARVSVVIPMASAWTHHLPPAHH